MLVMLSNCKGYRVKALAERFPLQLGHLFAPSAKSRDSGWRPPYPWLPYAVDNGAFGNHPKGSPGGLLNVLMWKVERQQMETGEPPLWMAVPDMPYNAAETLKLWKEEAPWWRALYPGWPLALVVQDGMTPADVLALKDTRAGLPEVIFVGGSTSKDGRSGWKWDTLPAWCAAFPRVHVGRVNSPEKLELCHRLGVESVDGTGWVRGGDNHQWRGLVAFLERGLRPQLTLPLAA